MTPTEKAETALNRRIERIQAAIAESKSETASRFLLQSLFACIGIAEALTGYVKGIGEFARARYTVLKQTHDALTADHAAMLKAGNELLEALKANPADKAIRKSIEQAQKGMENVQKALRRGANALQRETSPSSAIIEEVALSIRRLAEADQIDGLKRATRLVLGHVQALYRLQPTLPAKGIIDPTDWEKAALAQIDQATDFYEAFAHAGFQTMLAIDMMTLAVDPKPPHSAAEASQRANESVTARLKAITARFTGEAEAGPADAAGKAE
jgi:hypothetical protein